MGLNDEVFEAAQILRDELGNWMLSEVGEAGMDDVLWDHYPPYRTLSTALRLRFLGLVYKEIFR